MDINIALSPDDNYASYAKVVINSILANAKKTQNIHFWILDGGLNALSKTMLSSASEHLHFVDIPDGIFKDFPSNGYITVSTWYRFVISTLLPKSVSKVLYLDCDIAVNGDLQELFEIDIASFAVAAIKDCIWKKFNIRAGLRGDFHYFNAGVLLLNLDYWRKNDVQGRLFSFLGQSPKHLAMMDQTVLNIVLQNEYKELPLQWNVQFVPPFIEECGYEKSEFALALQSPKIIHYVNRFKPWSKDLGWLNPFNDLFTKFMDNDVHYTKNQFSIVFKLLWKRFMRKPMFFLRNDYWNNIFITREFLRTKNRK